MTKVQKHNRKVQLSNIAFVALILFVAAMFVVGPSEAEQDQETAFYCEMVAEGSWPDYKNIAEEHCK